MASHITPAIGEHEIASFGNFQMRDFVSGLAEKKLAPKTICEISNAVKQIVASAVDQNGDELFPRTWNSEFIDAPLVEKQKQPSVSAEQIELAIAQAGELDALLYALLAASGLRIGEAMSLRIGHPDSSSYFVGHAIPVQTSLWRRREQTVLIVPRIRDLPG